MTTWTATQKAAAIGLIALTLYAVSQRGGVLPGPSPVSEVKIAAIIGESADIPKLPKEQLLVIKTALDMGIKVVDRTPKDRDKKPPADLVPLLNAVGDAPGFHLAVEYKTGNVGVYPLPATPDKLREIVK
jgi:hypothetical protein